MVFHHFICFFGIFRLIILSHFRWDVSKYLVISMWILIRKSQNTSHRNTYKYNDKLIWKIFEHLADGNKARSINPSTQPTSFSTNLSNPLNSTGIISTNNRSGSPVAIRRQSPPRVRREYNWKCLKNQINHL